MDAKLRKQIKANAELMVSEAQSAENDRIFSATGFARENISIVHQQLRCVNLAWALRHTKKVKPGDVVAIVGGSFSGLMLACSLAIADDVIVYIFEKEKRLLHRFRDKSHRHLSPNLNSRYLGPKFSPLWSTPFFEPPIFKWDEDVASEVAATWLRQFEAYREKLPIFTFLGFEINSRSIKQKADGLTIETRTAEAQHLQPIDVDILIDATGFGEEGNPRGVVDYSYWEAGHRLIYDHFPRECKVLISGCGDSGLVEAMHYAIADFKHEDVNRFWPSRAHLEAHIDEGLKQAKMEDLFKSEEVRRYDGKVISELCWWLDSRFHSVNNRVGGWKFLPGEAAIFHKIDACLKKDLASAFPRRTLNRLEWEELEEFVFKLPMEVQLKVREAVQDLANDCISCRMAKLLGDVPIGKLLRMRFVHRMARRGVSVILNGTTPTPYTRQLSAFNTWLMRVLMTFPNVSYHQGLITDVKEVGKGKFRVTFTDREKKTSGREIYDRVITRYGPAKAKNANSLSTRHASDPHAGNYLLDRVTYTIPTNKPDIYQTIEPAVHAITHKLDRVMTRRGSTSASPLNKQLYRSRLLLGPIGTLKADKRYDDPQTWLSGALRSGKRPSYVENSLLKPPRQPPHQQSIRKQKRRNPLPHPAKRI